MHFKFPLLAALTLAASLATVGPVAEAQPAQGTIAIQTGSAPPVIITAEDVARLPVIQLRVAFDTEHGPRQALFEGPLLWTVLDHAHAIDPAKPSAQVREIIALTGRDGYSAVLGLGEISPDFEGKQVILAERMDGKPLGPDHLRVVVPGDRKGGRSVRDIVQITATSWAQISP
jgi:DMSO/TMAO reductase YedYZ molybdopterin-dependent catalytic subunit